MELAAAANAYALDCARGGMRLGFDVRMDPFTGMKDSGVRAQEPVRYVDCRQGNSCRQGEDIIGGPGIGRL